MTGKRDKVGLNDVIGIASMPVQEGRFHEIVSVEKIKDTKTGKVYHGIIDSDFIRLINRLDEENDELYEENQGLLKDYHQVMVENAKLKHKSDEYEKVMRKHNIGSIEKLDKLLGWEYRK